MHREPALENAARLPNAFKRRGIELMQGRDQFVPNLRRIPSQRSPHAVHRTEKIHHERRRRSLGPLKEQCGSVLLKYALRNFRDFELGIDFGANPLELTLLLQVTNKVLQTVKGHKGRLSWRVLFVSDIHRQVRMPGSAAGEHVTAFVFFMAGVAA